MKSQENNIQERNQEIGRILKEAREKKHISVTTCAHLIGTSRRRYVSMEDGEASIGVAELEVLIKFLGISIHTVWYGSMGKIIPTHEVGTYLGTRRLRKNIPFE